MALITCVSRGYNNNNSPFIEAVAALGVCCRAIALREIYPTLSLGCFLKKPVTIDYLVKRIKAQLD